MSKKVNAMPDYKKMYYILFNKITTIVAELQEAQQHTEELYINAEEAIIELYIQENQKEDTASTISPQSFYYQNIITAQKRPRTRINTRFVVYPFN